VNIDFKNTVEYGKHRSKSDLPRNLPALKLFQIPYPGDALLLIDITLLIRSEEGRDLMLIKAS
jgi:hypothetical protein